MNRQEFSADNSPNPLEITDRGAALLGRQIAAGELTASETVEAFIGRIEQVNEKINAVVAPLFDSARAEAKAADQAQREGCSLGPLHGVPVTIKECFHVAGAAATAGLSSRAGRLSSEDAPLVKRLREAGAIILGKTNVPQLMVLHETDNSVYGRTNNPWDLSRTPGGSSGGEAAIIAAGGSPLGLGSDLGGSIRIPAHFCGVSGLKPTSQRLTREGTVANFRGMGVMQFQPGPLARRVEDLHLGMKVLVGEADQARRGDVVPGPLPDPEKPSVAGMRIALWTDDGFFPASMAVRRAVEQAAAALRERGAIVDSFEPPGVKEAMGLYSAIISADGGADLRRLLKDSQVDWRVGRLVALMRAPNWLRAPTAAILRMAGQKWRAETVVSLGRCSADRFWRISWRMQHYVNRFLAALSEGGYDAYLSPPHALPATQHGRSLDLMPAASYSFLPNLLGVPAGVVAATRVAETETSQRAKSRDAIENLARAVDKGSAGLPVGVQVAAPHWREDTVLAVMKALEEAFRPLEDYPQRPLL